MVTCDYNKIKGYMVYEEGEIPLYAGNCLAVEVYNKETLCGFWCDIHHLKRMLGLEGDTYSGQKRDCYKDRLKKIRLSFDYSDNITIAKAFAKAGYVVEFYY